MKKFLSLCTCFTKYEGSVRWSEFEIFEMLVWAALIAALTVSSSRLTQAAPSAGNRKGLWGSEIWYISLFNSLEGRSLSSSLTTGVHLVRHLTARLINKKQRLLSNFVFSLFVEIVQTGDCSPGQALIMRLKTGWC